MVRRESGPVAAQLRAVVISRACGAVGERHLLQHRRAAGLYLGTLSSLSVLAWVSIGVTGHIDSIVIACCPFRLLSASGSGSG